MCSLAVVLTAKYEASGCIPTHQLRKAFFVISLIGHCSYLFCLSDFNWWKLMSQNLKWFEIWGYFISCIFDCDMSANHTRPK